jgi:hypothetical protein
MFNKENIREYIKSNNVEEIQLLLKDNMITIECLNFILKFAYANRCFDIVKLILLTY